MAFGDKFDVGQWLDEYEDWEDRMNWKDGDEPQEDGHYDMLNEYKASVDPYGDPVEED